MKKSLYSVATVAVAALALAACGAAPEDDPTTDPTTPDDAGDTSEPEEPPAEEVDFMACMISDEGGFDDASFNESGHNGLVKAQQELGIQISQAESQSPADFNPNVDTQIQAGCDLIIGVGFALQEAISAAAESTPETHFALVDEMVDAGLENAKGLVFNTQEAAFLAGYLAAGFSETGVVATYGGIAFPSVTIFMDGFVDGVAAYNEAKGEDVQVLGWNKDSQEGSMIGDFSDITAGYDTTQDFISRGADIILPVAGPVGGGSLRAASENEGVSVIWVDADGYEQADNAEFKHLILTSVLKEISNSVFDTIEESVNGEFTNEPYVGTLENGGVSIAPLHDFEGQVDSEIMDEIEELKQQIIAGDLTVDSVSATPVN